MFCGRLGPETPWLASPKFGLRTSLVRRDDAFGFFLNINIAAVSSVFLTGYTLLNNERMDWDGGFGLS